MEFKGTKGKWYISRQCDGLSIHSKMSPAGIDIICKIEDQFHKEDTEANALLISKAPEMLEAMQEFCDRADRGEVRSTKTYNKFKEIIKSATELKEE